MCFMLFSSNYFLPRGILSVVLLLILGLSCTSSSPVGNVGLIEADTLIVGLLVVVVSSSLVATGVNMDTAGADVVINVVVSAIVITEVILVDIVVIDTGDCPVVDDVIVTDGSPEVMVDIATGDCPEVVVDIATGDCPGDVVIVDIATGDCPGDVVIVDIATGDCPGDVVIVDIATGDCSGDVVIVDIATGDCPGDVVIVDMEIGDCPLDCVVTGPGDCDGEGVVRSGVVGVRPVGAASHWENVSEVLGSVAWKQNWSSGFPSFI